MMFVLNSVAALSLISTVTSFPTRLSRVSTCIERLNPFNWNCGGDVKPQGDTETVSLAIRDTSATSDTQMVQFADTFTHTTGPTSVGNSTVPFPGYPQGFAVEYPGFAYSSIKTPLLVMPSPPDFLMTDALIQFNAGRQPGIIRGSNTSSFDLRNLHFACLHIDESGNMELPSCLISFVCRPKTIKDVGIPSGHRPTPRSMLSSTFEFVPNLDQSSLSWPTSSDPDTVPKPRAKATIYATADFGDNFYDLDHCSIMLQQWAASSLASDAPPGVLIDDVVGVAYLGKQSAD